ncbi:diacylglycerol/lipid kinase family protein [Sphingobacterium sp. SGR-19]|uniref:diacylglycerol/lipid kinase family protein n=1 Tax=Sphingobacterium sp. SGR-19 TaxID=2710886 RepID=UPI0013EB37C5|nr:diacylglycerol kinase family protein [Sphingobacterium sp. SGR-19]NGM66977.1 diacylglycerol kinase [Sphingobacterium sp. SGR-19]
MKQVILLHNPNAGDADHFKTDLIEAIEKEGYRCTYFSIKDNDSWKHQLNEADFVVVAGGDGTVRKVVKALVQRGVNDKRIIMALLPMGTANNLSKTLFLDKEASFEDHVGTWKYGKRQRFDVGMLAYDSSFDFFLEGVGYGLFPTLVQTMDKIDVSHLETTEEQLQLALEKLHQIILTAEAYDYIIHVDEKAYEGRYLLLEVMNIPSIGPNLVLAPAAQIDDGYLDLVMITEEERNAFALHVKKIIDQEETSFDFQTLRAKKFKIQSTNKNIHIDDKCLSISNGSLTIQVDEHILDLIM